jgi:hypothetical protein
MSLAIMSAAGGPAATAAAGSMTQAAAGGLSALSSLAGGVMQSRAARTDAESARAAAAAKARRIRAAGERELGQARGDAVGAGVSVASGSVMEAERQIVRNVEQDAGLAIVSGNSQAAALETQGQAALINGALGAASNIAFAADRWKRARNLAGYGQPIQNSPMDPRDY